MKIIYTSTLGAPKTENNQLVIAPINNENNFVNNLKNCLSKTDNLLFITNRWESETSPNQPKDEVFNDYHYTNKQYAETLFKNLELSGIKFKKLTLVDCNYTGNFESDLINADMVFVQGGHTPRGLKILKQLNFEDLVKNFYGVLFMTGTSSKLPATKALSTHHGSLTDFEVEESLGLKNYSIRPHFEYNLKELLNKKFRIRVKLIKEFSKHIKVFAISNNSYIIDDNNKITIYGECHLFNNGKLKKLCSNGKTKTLK